MKDVGSANWLVDNGLSKKRESGKKWRFLSASAVLVPKNAEMSRFRDCESK